MDQKLLLESYERMALIRAFEERCLDLKASNDIPGSVHLCNGQEAIPVGACFVLEPRDALTATYRGHGWALARGIPAADIFAELMGRDSPLCGGRAGSPYFSSAAHGFLGENSIVGGGVPIATGAALAAKVKQDGSVSVVSIGDGALNQGSVHEALNFAAVFDLPLVVVVENNVYSEMTPIRDMCLVEPLSKRAEAYGMPGETVDGNDVAPVMAAVATAVERARRGEGPTMVEAMTERLVGHYSGDVQHYRPAGEIADAKTREPLVRIRNLATEDADLTNKMAEIDERVEARIAEALDAARSVPYPSPDTVREHVYV